MDTKKLINEALNVRKNAYAPYSSFCVGAALLSKSGEIYTGCNIESASFSPTCCAERVAFFKAVSNGERHFEAIAVVGGKSGENEFGICSPCGVCRQVLSEFCDDDFIIILSDGKEQEKLFTLGQLLPERFILQAEKSYEK